MLGLGLLLGSACTPGPAPSVVPSTVDGAENVSAGHSPAGATQDVGSRVPPGLRWLAVSGGGSAVATQVSLEQDLALLRDTLGAHGNTLFAGGPSARGVVVAPAASTAPPADALRLALGDFLAPGDGRDGSLRAPTIQVDGSTDPITVEVHVRGLVAAAAEGPRLLYLGGHGEPTATPLGTSWTAWGSETVPLTTWVSWLQDPVPTEGSPLVAINTLCFGGGMTQAVFIDGDPKSGVFSPHLCAFTATTADAPASGCDPNPDRNAQDGYALHIFHALQGLDRVGHRASPSPDLDGDGKITLLEAHMYAVVGLAGPDVPLTSSDAYLAWWATQRLPAADATHSPNTDGATVPEWGWVVEALSAQLSLHPDAHIEGITVSVDVLRTQVEVLDEQITQEAEAEELAWWEARTALLDRWPELEDPWRPDFEQVLRGHHEEIQAFLDNAPSMTAWRATVQRTNAVAMRLADVEAQLARYRRLLQVRRTDTLLRRLPSQGRERAHLDALLACERSVWRRVEPSLQRLPSPAN